MSTGVIATIYMHEIYSGSTFTGVDSNGTSTEESLFRGRIQEWLGGTAGGQFTAPDIIGMTVEHVCWNLDCTAPNVYIYIVDDGGIEYLIDSQTGIASGDYVHPNDGFVVPPGWKVRFKASKAIDAVVSIAGEDTGVTGDGTSSDYSISLVHGKVKPGTVSIVAGSVTFTDPGSDGILVGAGGGGGSGTINYYTGAISITVNTPASFNSINALATYDYNKVGRVFITIHDNWGQATPSQIGLIGEEHLPPSMM